MGARKSAWGGPTTVPRSGSDHVCRNLEAWGAMGLMMKRGNGEDSPSIVPIPTSNFLKSKNSLVRQRTEAKVCRSMLKVYPVENL